eukprot:gene1438-2059_t
MKRKKNRRCKVQVRLWKSKTQQGPKVQKRIIRRKELAHYSHSPLNGKKHLRRMTADLDKYIKAKFNVYADAQEAMTTVAFKVVLPHAELDPNFHGLNSPFSSQSVLVFEGKEAFHEAKDVMGRLLEELRLKPPEDYVGDVLHFALREVLHSLEVTVRRRCTTRDKINLLAEFLKRRVKCHIRVKKVENKQGMKEGKTPNIIGRECSLTMHHSEEMVHTVIPEPDGQFAKAMA